ncbi:MAG: hypothetical protein SGJ18_16585 [Pseudomonadota bacterium]|nr:hypothetical protein [Pseudomonadota bacterium]
MLVKYRNEPLLVRNHLHVFAIEESVYRTLDPTGKLGSTARKMDESYGADYVRAWNIVSSEGPQIFLTELHSR